MVRDTLQYIGSQTRIAWRQLLIRLSLLKPTNGDALDRLFRHRRIK